jgi:bifunctional DNA-binding transcriptional regulator/antitoxin component of YhaV-PrlF toxin-antitoxin module
MVTDPKPVAVVGPDGTLILPSALCRRYELEPGVVLGLVERDDGVVELHRHTGPSLPGAKEAFWNSWWEQTQSSADETSPL